MADIGPVQTLPQLLSRRAKATPDAVAFMTRESSGLWRAMPWEPFYCAVQQLASKLWHHGLRSGEQVALLMPNGVQWEIVQHAVYHLGGVVIGLDLNDPAERMEAIFTLCSPAVLIIDHPSRLAQVPSRNHPRPKILISGGEPKKTQESEVFAVSYLDTLPDHDGPITLPHIDGDAMATILFTSGTTGLPKALSYRHRQLVLAIDQITPCFADLPEQAHTACWLPLANPFQRMINFCAMAMNWKAFMVPVPSTIMEMVPAIEPHLFAAVPRFYEKLYDGINRRIQSMPKATRRMVHWARRIGEDCRRSALSGSRPPWLKRRQYAIAERLVLRKIRGAMGANLRYFISGSAAMPVRLIEAFGALGWTVLEAYGISENIVPMTMNMPRATRPGSVGRPLPANRLRIAEDGEILVQSEGIAIEAPVGADGFFKTGDTGRLDEDGYLWLTGRKNDMFKLSTGRKVIPQMIEEAVAGIEGVEHCLALGGNQKYVAMLLNVPAAAWETLKEKHHGAQGAMTYLLERSRNACSHLPAYCRPVDILVIHETFSPQTGELTANLKLRRNTVIEKHRNAIEVLFERVPNAGHVTQEGDRCGTTS